MDLLRVGEDPGARIPGGERALGGATEHDGGLAVAALLHQRQALGPQRAGEQRRVAEPLGGPHRRLNALDRLRRDRARQHLDALDLAIELADLGGALGRRRGDRDVARAVEAFARVGERTGGTCGVGEPLAIDARQHVEQGVERDLRAREAAEVALVVLGGDLVALARQARAAMRRRPALAVAFTPATFWLAAADLEHSAGHARSPVIVSQPDLWMTAAWLQESDILGEFAVYASRFDLGLHSFGSFLRMNALGTSGEAPAVATTDNHASIATWRSPLPLAAVKLEFTRIDAAGAVDGPHTLATDDAIVFNHDASMFPSGRAFAVWVQETPTGFGVYAAERR